MADEPKDTTPTPPQAGWDRPYGELNPIRKKRTGGKIDPNTISYTRAVQEATLRQSAQNVYKGQRAIKGVVLYAYQDSLNVVHVKARIPELHCFPPPGKLPTANDMGDEEADWDTISLHPTFVAASETISLLGLPSPESIVYLDFEHPSTFEGPIYLGPVNVDAMPNPEAALPNIQALDWSSVIPFDTVVGNGPWPPGPGVTPENKYSLGVWWDGGVSSILRTDLQEKLKNAGITKLIFILDKYHSFNGQTYKSRFGHDYRIKVGLDKMKRAIDVCLRLGIKHSFMTYPYPDYEALKKQGPDLAKYISDLRSEGSDYLPQKLDLDLEENWILSAARRRQSRAQIEQADNFLMMTTRTALANSGVALGCNFIHWTLSSKSNAGRSCLANILMKCDIWTTQAYAANNGAELPHRTYIAIKKADKYAEGTKIIVHAGLSAYGQTPNKGSWAGKVTSPPHDNMALALTTAVQTNPKPREFWYWSSKHIFGLLKSRGPKNNYSYPFFVNWAKPRFDELNSSVSTPVETT